MIDASGGTFSSLGGMRLIADPHMTDTIEDWSEVRSPSRAQRRRRQGHRQRIRYFQKPKPTFYQAGNALIAHPEMIAKLVAAASAR